VQEREVVDRYFAAMRRGAEAEEEMMALFADDAVYVDPFSGESRVSTGKEAIRATLRSGWEFPLPELKLTVDEITIEPGRATSTWTCESPALPRPIRGCDRYVIRDGEITRLEVELLDGEDPH
jgi:hypothetical protein